MINKPIDKHNHCFVGDTLISTDKGFVKMSDIKKGDKVLTSKGYKVVLKKFNNGKKQVNSYLMHFGTIIVKVDCTNNHKFKTSKEWIQVKELKKDSLMYLHKHLTEKNTIFTMGKDISLKELKDYIELFGNTTMAKYQKDIIYTILMVIVKTMKYITYSLLKQIYIFHMSLVKGLRKIQNGLKVFTLKALRRLKNGISQMKVENGTNNTQKNNGLIEKLLNTLVKNVEMSMKQNIEEFQNTAIIIAKLNLIEESESYEADVYDIMVEDCHEYFANGILVHNCIDAVRYATYSVLSKPNFGRYAIM
jgi:hypothetical protein